MNLLYILLISLLLSRCRADPLGNYCNENTSINSSSQISLNIDRLLAEVVSKASLTGYIATSSGKDPNKSMVLLNAEKMLAVKTVQVAYKMQQGKYGKAVQIKLMQGFGTTIAFYRTAKRILLEKLKRHSVYSTLMLKMSDPQKFNKELGALMDKIRSEAVMPKNEGLGKGKTKLSPFLTLYALVQCTRDLSPIDCAQCLAIVVGNFPNICDSSKGCRILYSSCYIRYELYPFFFPLDSTNGTSFGKTEVIVYQ